ncbi:MAG: transposase, partial [Clostridia bacterium]
MPRIARKKSESGYYHIVLRGINKQNLFYDDEDKVVLLNRFKLIKKQNDFDLVAFCIMCNHVHLLVKEKTTSISNIIRKALSSYVFWY